MKTETKKIWRAIVIQTHSGLFAGMLLCSPLANADNLAIGEGYGNIKSQEATATFLRYQKDAPRLWNQDSFYEIALGSWNGSNHNNASGVARGLRWPWSQKNFISTELGIAYVTRTTDHLGTQGQFFFHGTLGRQFEKYTLSIGETHYSNGQRVLHWHGPNVGEDFLTLQLGRKF
jgi:hypothetical protein